LEINQKNTKMARRLELLRHLSNLPGWRTSKRYIIFESDDWGAIRMASNEVYMRLKSKGLKPHDDDEDRYLSNDCLASEEDLYSLFSVLVKFRDTLGNHPVFTAFALPANPDFEKIAENRFQNYFYEPFTKTLKRYGKTHENSFSMWKEGIKKKIFIPQFHGREHLNVVSWLKALRMNEIDTVNSFYEQVYGITPRTPVNHITYQSAFNIETLDELQYLKEVISEGLLLFEELFN